MKPPTPRATLPSREASRADCNIVLSRILAKGYLLSVDDGFRLVLVESKDKAAILKAIRGIEVLIWLRDSSGSKFGWMKLSETGKVIDHSARDKRMEIVQ